MTSIHTIAGALVLAVALGAAAPARADQLPRPLPSVNLTSHQVVRLMPRPPAELEQPKPPGALLVVVAVAVFIIWVVKHPH